MALVLRKTVLPRNITLLKCLKGRPLATAPNKMNPAPILTAQKGECSSRAVAGPKKADGRSASCPDLKAMLQLAPSTSFGTRSMIHKLPGLQINCLIPCLTKTYSPLTLVRLFATCPPCPEPCAIGSCGLGGTLPPPCNTPPKCVQYMTGYYYYPYGFWFCGPYHIGGCCTSVTPAGCPKFPGPPCPACCCVPSMAGIDGTSGKGGASGKGGMSGIGGVSGVPGRAGGKARGRTGPARVPGRGRMITCSAPAEVVAASFIVNTCKAQPITPDTKKKAHEQWCQQCQQWHFSPNVVQQPASQVPQSMSQWQFDPQTNMMNFIPQPQPQPMNYTLQPQPPYWPAEQMESQLNFAALHQQAKQNVEQIADQMASQQPSAAPMQLPGQPRAIPGAQQTSSPQQAANFQQSNVQQSAGAQNMANTQQTDAQAMAGAQLAAHQQLTSRMQPTCQPMATQQQQQTPVYDPHLRFSRNFPTARVGATSYPPGMTRSSIAKLFPFGKQSSPKQETKRAESSLPPKSGPLLSKSDKKGPGVAPKPSAKTSSVGNMGNQIPPVLYVPAVNGPLNKKPVLSSKQQKKSTLRQLADICTQSIVRKSNRKTAKKPLPKSVIPILESVRSLLTKEARDHPYIQPGAFNYSNIPHYRCPYPRPFELDEKTKVAPKK